MLKKNVYVLYPPGYSGSFINWAINISDSDLFEHTVKNPTNTSDSDIFGGAGTAHLHTRIPTHQDVIQHLTWMLYNQPDGPRVYVINAKRNFTYLSINLIAQYDPDGVFINIHAGNDDLTGSFGTINCITKWPIYLPALLALNPLVSSTPLHKEFDPTNCANDIAFRNWMVLNDDMVFGHNQPLVHTRLQRELQKNRDWYRARHQAQPHEVNENMYIPDPDLNNRLFEINCADVSRPEFLQWFDQFMLQSQISDRYNSAHVATIHPSYCAAQTNLQWFDSIDNWKQTGQLDEYLLSHSVIQSQVIGLIFKHSGKMFLTKEQQDRWISFYFRCRGPSWPDSSLDEYDFFKFPAWLQDEIKTLGYQFNIPGPPIQEIIDLDWENASLQQINDVYQKYKAQPRN